MRKGEDKKEEKTGSRCRAIFKVSKPNDECNEWKLPTLDEKNEDEDGRPVIRLMYSMFDHKEHLGDYVLDIGID